jgi:hypothetical protein
LVCVNIHVYYIINKYTYDPVWNQN